MPYSDPEIRRQKAKEYSRKAYERKLQKALAAGHVSSRGPAWTPEKRKEYHREWNKRQRAVDPTPQREALKRSREKHYDKRLAANRDWGRRNPDKQQDIRLRSRYGITSQEFDGMLIEQAGRCWICDDPMEKPMVDHCHKSDRVRGLLCRLCNAAIGMLRDDPKIIRAALKYVMKD